MVTRPVTSKLRVYQPSNIEYKIYFKFPFKVDGIPLIFNLHQFHLLQCFENDTAFFIFFRGRHNHVLSFITLAQFEIIMDIDTIPSRPVFVQ